MALPRVHALPVYGDRRAGGDARDTLSRSSSPIGYAFGLQLLIILSAVHCFKQKVL